MEIKAHDTFWQRRKLRGHGLQPILMEVLEVEEVIGTRDICKVRWHILGKDSVSTSVFPMATITEGHFADFVPIPREFISQGHGHPEHPFHRLSKTKAEDTIPNEGLSLHRR